MVERIKNKKGFTIIEIMVVIALIGILAAVLVPKFGGVRDTAKNTGMLTNVKMVEAYVASVIDSYKTTENTLLDTAITTQFNDSNNPLVNPYTGEEDDTNINVSVVDVAASPTAGTPGVVYVVIDDDTLDTFINGMDANGNSIKSTEREITR
jgi:type IV pilus assembly protein PilA